MTSMPQNSERLIATVEGEHTVYTTDSSRNGSDPLWCSSSTCLVRVGDDLFATAQETLPEACAPNDTRWALYHFRNGQWQRVLADAEGRTIEPCPLAVLSDGRLFISGNPSVPDANNGARPEIVEVDASAPTRIIRRHRPAWAGSPSFNQHSYRAFAADGMRRELVLFQNVGCTHAEWALMDCEGQWLTGRLVWPLYEDPSFEPYGATLARVNYMLVALRGREVHVCGVSAHNKWRCVRDRPELMGRCWGNRFRRLYYAWTPNIVDCPFSQWRVVDHTEDDGGWLFPGDLHLDDSGAVHLLYQTAPISRTLRDLHFPDIARKHSLRYARLEQGNFLEHRVLTEGGDGGDAAVPFDLSQEELVFRWAEEPILTSRWATPRFHESLDGRLFAFYYVSGQDKRGRPVSENWLLQVSPAGGPDACTAVPLRSPLTQFFSATPRAGCVPAEYLDLLGYRKGGFGLFSGQPTTVSHARLRVDAAPDGSGQALNAQPSHLADARTPSG